MIIGHRKSVLLGSFWGHVTHPQIEAIELNVEESSAIENTNSFIMYLAIDEKDIPEEPFAKKSFAILVWVVPWARCIYLPIWEQVMINAESDFCWDLEKITRLFKVEMVRAKLKSVRFPLIKSSTLETTW
jgi:hypothetical protein